MRLAVAVGLLVAVGFPGDMISGDMASGENDMKGSAAGPPPSPSPAPPCTLPTDQDWDYLASDLALSDGADVATWANTGSVGSGMNLTAAGAAQPQYDTVDPQIGIPAVRFAPGDFEIMRSPTISAISPPFTACAVWMMADGDVRVQNVSDGRSNALRFTLANTLGTGDLIQQGNNAGLNAVHQYSSSNGIGGKEFALQTMTGNYRWDWACWRLDGAGSASYGGFRAETSTEVDNDITGLALGGRTIGASFLDGAIVRYSMWENNTVDLRTTARCYAEKYVFQACAYPAGSPCTDGKPCHLGVIGDSIDDQSATAGRGDYSVAWRTETREAFSDSQAHCLFIENFANGSETTSDIDDQVQDFIIGKDFDAVVMGGGINDIAGGVPQATIKATLRSTFDDLIADGVDVIFRELLPTLTESDTDIEDINTYVAAQTDIALLTGLGGGRLHDEAESTPGSNVLRSDWDADNIHLNPAGAKALGRYLAQQVGPSYRCSPPAGYLSRWRGEDLRGVLADADPISSIPSTGSDVSPLEQATASDQPTWESDCLNGKGCFVFDGDDHVEGTPAAMTSGFTAGCVFEIDVFASNKSRAIFGDIGADVALLRTLKGTDEVQLVGSAILTGSAISIDTWQSAVMTVDGINSALLHNGAESLGTVATGTSVLAYMGARNGQKDYMTGRVAECVTYDNATVDRQDLEDYFTCEYGAFPQAQ